MPLFDKALWFRLLAKLLMALTYLNLYLLDILISGISGKSQILFAIVFTTRYLDLLTSFISLYNTCMKVRHQSCLGLDDMISLLCSSHISTCTLDDFFVVVYQVIYIGCAYATVYLIYMKFRATYDGNHDSFRVEFLVVPVGGLAVLINHDFSFLEVGSFCVLVSIVMDTFWKCKINCTHSHSN